jgi:hypothetical protein
MLPAGRGTQFGCRGATVCAPSSVVRSTHSYINSFNYYPAFKAHLAAPGAEPPAYVEREF